MKKMKLREFLGKFNKPNMQINGLNKQIQKLLDREIIAIKRSNFYTRSYSSCDKCHKEYICQDCGFIDGTKEHKRKQYIIIIKGKRIKPYPKHFTIIMNLQYNYYYKKWWISFEYKGFDCVWTWKNFEKKDDKKYYISKNNCYEEYWKEEKRKVFSEEDLKQVQSHALLDGLEKK